MKKGRRKSSNSYTNCCNVEVQFNGRRHSLSCDRDVIRHTRRSVDRCNNTLPLSKRSAEVMKLNVNTLGEMREIVEIITPPMSKSSRESSVTIESPPESPLAKERLSSESPSRDSPSKDLSLRDSSISESLLSSRLASCKYCRESNENVLICSEPLDGAFEEEDVLNFREIRSSWKTDKPLLNLADFRVYDEARHLCPFDGKLIKDNVSLYFSGFVKPGDSETEDRGDGFPCEDMGPVTEWWVIGYELGSKTVIGISSELADYCLTQPLEEYIPCMRNLNEKVFMAKSVIDILQKTDDELSYVSLLDILQTLTPPTGVPNVTEEILLRNGPFICEQVLSFDTSADVDDKLLSFSPCIKDLSQKVNFDLDAKGSEDEDNDDDDEDDEEDKDDEEDDIAVEDDYVDVDDELAVKNVRRRREPMRKRTVTEMKSKKLSMATTTRLVSNIFEDFFRGQISRKSAFAHQSKDTVRNHWTNNAYHNAKYNSLIRDCSVRLTRLEDMGLDLQNCSTFNINDYNFEEKVNNCIVENKFGEYNSNEKVEECNSEENLDVAVPITRELKAVKLTRLSDETLRFYLNKKYEKRIKNAKRRRNRGDSSESESEFEYTQQKRKFAKIDDLPLTTVEELRKMLKMKKSRRHYPSNVRWTDEPIKEVDGYSYYKSVIVNNVIVSIGDFVSTFKSNSVARIKYLWENNDGEKLFHAHWFIRSMDTILGEVGHPNELFVTNSCEDVLLKEMCQVVNVSFIPLVADWHEVGNTTLMDWLAIEKDPVTQLYYQRRYCDKSARFEDVEPELPSSLIDCDNCEKERKIVQREIPYCEEKCTFDREMKMYSLSMIRWRDEEYRAGSCVFLNPGSIMRLQTKGKENVEEEEDYDEDLYPEKYRKPAHVKSMQDDDVLSDPFEIGYICNIWTKRQEITSSSDVKLEVKKFYRPHNTSLTQNIIRKLDLNLLYWSDEDCLVDFSKVQGKCFVAYEENLGCSVDEWTNKGPYRFYFSQAYNKKYKLFETPPLFATKIGKFEKSEGKELFDVPPDYPPISRPLRSLDVFAGCGGLTEGLHQANIAKCLWAIEKDSAAAQAFQINYPDAAVFTDDCNELLNAIIDRKEKIRKGKNLPQRGEVELLCGGPPCQGYSGMNRFRFGQWSKFNNSLIVSYLSYCDYFRPRFFILENVRNFVSHEKSIVLKLTLNCLIKMGYQVGFAVMQSGRFGIPQSRRRVIILAAAPGEVLPSYPEHTHTFAQSGFEKVNVDDVKYSPNINWTSSAPYRMITVYDALSDLPPIKEGDSQAEKRYGRKPITHFQRQLRMHNGEEVTVLRDHISKSLSALVVKRLSFIPKKPGCDWRDLPNIVVKLSDGTYTKKLEYTHHDARQGKSPNGALRGVCSCANHAKCKPEFRQSDTLIPWCLPHTSNRHGHWRGLYGRLGWDEYFRTVVTNPEPMGKQGRVVHPEEDRVLSVRECARSQGFPDKFKFYGYILDKHRQVGNAVAPPLAKAIGLEIRKSIHAVESRLRSGVN